MFNIKTHYKLVAVFLFVLTLSLITGGKASAATITVNTDTNPSPCTLDEAIVNINDGADTNTDCVETGSYGTDDTITIPAGTVLLTADLPQINKPATIKGAGMGQTIIDGDGSWQALNIDLTAGNFNLTEFTVTGYDTTGVLVKNAEELNITQIEIDGDNVSASSGTLLALAVENDTSYTNVISLSDIYIHDFDVDASNIFQVLPISTSGQSETVADISRVTISRLSNTGAVQTILLGPLSDTDNGNSAYTADVSNVTISDISSSSSMAIGITSINFNNPGMNPVVNLANATVLNVRSAEGLPLSIPVISAAGGALGAGDIVHSEMNLNNIVVAGSEGSSINCGKLDISPIIGGAGASEGSLSSQGGNLSDDNTCSPYFTQPTDQNNLTNLASTLDPLADNGGYVPTMALRQGSPAIDAGVTVAGLTNDARLAVRPQGAAFDSGAYESPFTKPAVTSVSLASTGSNTVFYGLIGLLTVGFSGFVLVRKLK